MLTTLPFLQIGLVLASRTTRDYLFRRGLMSNPTLLAMVVLVTGQQQLAVYLPSLQRFFGVLPLFQGELLLCVGLGSLSFGAIELEKWWLCTRGIN
jgi:Ca2+-transporting ATPase